MLRYRFVRKYRNVCLYLLYFSVSGSPKEGYCRVAGRQRMEAQQLYMQKDSLRIALEGVLLISWRLPTLPRVCSTIGVTGLNFSVRNGKRWNPGAITTRMGDMMNVTLYLQTTTSLKKCAEETKPRGFYAMIYRSFLFRLSSLLQGQKYDLRHIPG